MNIAHINLARGFRGGERQTVLLIESLAQCDDIQQILVCREDSPMRDYVRDLPHVRILSARTPWQGHCAVKADILHAHEARAVHWAALHHLYTHVPYIITRRVNFNIKNNMLSRYSYRKAAMRVSISQVIAGRIAHLGEGRIITDAFGKLPENPTLTAHLREKFAGHFIIGHIGALVDSDKGQSDLIAVARQFQTLHPQCLFIFLGGGIDEARLKQESADLTNVCWLGFQKEVGSYLAIMDIFAFPSRTEGLGSTLLDAMAYGVPIVASNTGGIPEIIRHGKTGLLFESGDISALAEALNRLYQDTSLRQKLVDKARQNLTEFSAQQMANHYQKIYQQILSTSP